MTYIVRQARDGRTIERSVSSAKDAGEVAASWAPYGQVWIVAPGGELFSHEAFQVRIVDAVKYRNS